MTLQARTTHFPNLGFPVPSRSWKEIADMALRDRYQMGYFTEHYFPIENIEILFQKIDSEFHLLAESASLMDSCEGIACPWDHCIILREDILLALEKKDPRARFTLAHELGHYRLHKKIPLGYARDIHPAWPAYMDSEKQANAYAARLLMPLHQLQQCQSIKEIMDEFGVSRTAAEFNFSKYCFGNNNITNQL